MQAFIHVSPIMMIGSMFHPTVVLPGKTELRYCPPITAVLGISAEFGGKNSSMVPQLHCTSPFLCFSDHMFTDSTYFPPFFRSFCAGPVLQGNVCAKSAQVSSTLYIS